jgi:methyl-accepting chemotaxis protein
MFSLVIVLVLVFISFGLLGTYLIHRSMRPVRQMSESARNISDSHLDLRLAVPPGNDEVAQMAKITDDTVNELAKGFSGEQREKFVEFMHNAVRPEVLEQAAMASMVKIFTAEELNALADFFGSPLGQNNQL